jgi:uncharacterized membrane protein
MNVGDGMKMVISGGAVAPPFPAPAGTEAGPATLGAVPTSGPQS